MMFLPLAAMTAGSSREIVTLIFGTEYIDSAHLLSILIFGSIGMVFISVNYAILTASGKPGVPLVLGITMVPLAVLGYLLIIPTMGMNGAATVFTFVAWIGAAISLAVVYFLWQVYPPVITFCRSALISFAAFIAATLWSTPGPLVLLKLSVIIFTIFITYWLTGEPERYEIEYIRSIINSSILRRKT